MEQVGGAVEQIGGVVEQIGEVDEEVGGVEDEQVRCKKIFTKGNVKEICSKYCRAVFCLNRVACLSYDINSKCAGKP